MKRFLALILPLTLLAGAAAPLAGQSILLVPFANRTSSPKLDWIGESLAETVREGLGSHGLAVVTRQERQEAAQRLSLKLQAPLTRASVLRLGGEMGVRTVVHGEFAFTGAEGEAAVPRGRIEITARLINLPQGRMGPVMAESGLLSELATLQTRLAWRVLRTLRPEGSPTEEAFFRSHPPARLDAMENYIRGLLAASQEQQHRFFTQAARLDARFSPPRFQLGRIQWEKGSYQVAAEWLEQVGPADAHYYQARFLLGLSRYYSGDFARAAAAFEDVHAAYALPEIRNNLGIAQMQLNRPEAMESFTAAIQANPSDPDYLFNAGYLLWRSGDYGQAAERFRAVLERDPEDAEATLMLGRCIKQSAYRPGDPRAEALERLKENFDEVAARMLQLPGLRHECGQPPVTPARPAPAK